MNSVSWELYLAEGGGKEQRSWSDRGRTKVSVDELRGEASG